MAGRDELALAIAQNSSPTAITLDISFRHRRVDRARPAQARSGNASHPGARHSVEEPARRPGAGRLHILKKSGGKEIFAEALFESSARSSGASRTAGREKDDPARQKILQLIANGDVHTTALGSAKEALAAFRSQNFDCVVLDPSLPDMAASEFIHSLQSAIGERDLPIILYPPDMSPEESSTLHQVAENIVLRRADTSGTALDETALFLHSVEANLPQGKREMLEHVRPIDPALAGRTGADRGRRCAQHLRADQRAGTE